MMARYEIDRGLQVSMVKTGLPALSTAAAKIPLQCVWDLEGLAGSFLCRLGGNDA